MSLAKREETLCLGSVRHSKPEGGSTQDAAPEWVVAPDAGISAAEIETGGSGC